MSDLRLWSHYQLETPEAFAGGHSRQDALFKRIRSLAKSGKVLEIGFGDGYLLSLLPGHFEAHGADISPESVERMGRQLPSVTFATIGLDGRLPYPDETFDLFVASEVLEHLDDRQLASTVAEMNRVLKPSGYALLTFPARENLKENECYCPHCGETFHKWGHKQDWNHAKIRSLFSNFAIERIEECYFVTPQLNLFGRLEGYARIALSKIRQVSNMTFVVTLRK